MKCGFDLFYFVFVVFEGSMLYITISKVKGLFL